MRCWARQLALTIIFVSWFAVAACPEVSADGKLLRWKFQQGDRFHVMLRQTSVHETRVNNRPLKMTLKMTTELDWIVDSVDEQGRGVITQSFRRMALLMDNDQGESIEFDSASQGQSRGLAKEIAQRISPLIGLKLQVTMNDRGEIVDTSFSKEAEKILEAESKDGQIRKLFSKEGLTQMLRQSAAVLPEQPVSPDDTWTVKTASKSPIGDLDQVHNFTYEGEEQKNGHTLQKIVVETSLALAKSKGNSEPSMKLEDQTQTGTLYFDAEAGNFVASTIDQKFTSQTPYREMIIRSTVDSTLTMTIERTRE
jgi:hypothetical protein